MQLNSTGLVLRECGTSFHKFLFDVLYNLYQYLRTSLGFVMLPQKS